MIFVVGTGGSGGGVLEAQSMKIRMSPVVEVELLGLLGVSKVFS